MNPELIIWDYNKEITLTLEDALFSAKSLAMMYGVSVNDAEEFAEAKTVRKTITKKQFDAMLKTANKVMIGEDEFTYESITYYDAEGKDKNAESTAYTKEDEEVVYAVAVIKVAGTEISIGADNFPGTYYITGDKLHNCLHAA